jgi:hypothetical protein
MTWFMPNTATSGFVSRLDQEAEVQIEICKGGLLRSCGVRNLVAEHAVPVLEPSGLPIAGKRGEDCNFPPSLCIYDFGGGGGKFLSNLATALSRLRCFFSGSFGGFKVLVAEPRQISCLPAWS